MGALETNTTLIYGIHLRESADDGSDFSNAAADYRVLFLGEDGYLHVKDSSGTVTDAYESGAGLGAWTDYTPSFTATSSNPTLGSSTLTGRYKALDSKTYIIHINLTITTGGAWNAGSGNWQFSLPAGLTSATRTQLLTGHCLDSGTTNFVLVGKVASGDTKVFEVNVADGSNPRNLTNNAPITWATGDTVTLCGTIEVQ